MCDEKYFQISDEHEKYNYSVCTEFTNDGIGDDFDGNVGVNGIDPYCTEGYETE